MPCHRVPSCLVLVSYETADFGSQRKACTASVAAHKEQLHPDVYKSSVYAQSFKLAFFHTGPTAGKRQLT